MQEPAVDTLRMGVGGSLITPLDPGYDEAWRLWNAGNDRRPAAIA